ncbi:hypothetical protein KJ652_01755 [Patescibacteria group bacterium]|nr:hypothetical protein [Patescibacteria group bacterium]
MKLFKNQMVRQLIGAVVGAAVAFSLYVGYKEAAPRITALTQTYWGGANSLEARFSRGDIDMSDQQMARQASRNREISIHFASQEQPGGLNVPFNRIAEKASQFEQELTPEQEAQIMGAQEVGPFIDTKVNDEITIQYPDQAASVADENEQKWENDWEQMERVPLEGGNEDLPDSGIGLWLAASGALVVTGRLRRKKK